eukprot:gene883-512_t
MQDWISVDQLASLEGEGAATLLEERLTPSSANDELNGGAGEPPVGALLHPNLLMRAIWMLLDEESQQRIAGLLRVVTMMTSVGVGLCLPMADLHQVFSVAIAAWNAKRSGTLCRVMTTRRNTLSLIYLVLCVGSNVYQDFQEAKDHPTDCTCKWCTCARFLQRMRKGVKDYCKKAGRLIGDYVKLHVECAMKSMCMALRAVQCLPPVRRILDTPADTETVVGVDVAYKAKTSRDDPDLNRADHLPDILPVIINYLLTFLFTFFFFLLVTNPFELAAMPRACEGELWCSGCDPLNDQLLSLCTSPALFIYTIVVQRSQCVRSERARSSVRRTYKEKGGGESTTSLSHLFLSLALSLQFIIPFCTRRYLILARRIKFQKRSTTEQCWSGRVLEVPFGYFTLHHFFIILLRLSWRVALRARHMALKVLKLIVDSGVVEPVLLASVPAAEPYAQVVVLLLSLCRSDSAASTGQTGCGSRCLLTTAATAFLRELLKEELRRACRCRGGIVRCPHMWRLRVHRRRGATTQQEVLKKASAAAIEAVARHERPGSPASRALQRTARCIILAQHAIRLAGQRTQRQAPPVTHGLYRTGSSGMPACKNGGRLEGTAQHARERALAATVATARAALSSGRDIYRRVKKATTCSLHYAGATTAQQCPAVEQKRN